MMPFKLSIQKRKMELIALHLTFFQYKMHFVLEQIGEQLSIV